MELFVADVEKLRIRPIIFFICLTSKLVTYRNEKQNYERLVAKNATLLKRRNGYRRQEKLLTDQLGTNNPVVYGRYKDHEIRT